MSDQTPTEKTPAAAVDIRDVVRHAIEEFVRAEQEKAEPAYKAELQDERKRREGLEARLNQLVEENRKGARDCGRSRPKLANSKRTTAAGRGKARPCIPGGEGRLHTYGGWSIKS